MTLTKELCEKNVPKLMNSEELFIIIIFSKDTNEKFIAKRFKE
jgi:hypothetical protein